MNIDQYYTPTSLATKLYDESMSYNVVADFAIGDGSLIDNMPFKPKKVIGLDINKDVIKDLLERNRDWVLNCDDFLFPSDKTRQWLEGIKDTIDLIVLNPPFSCKKKKSIIISINNINYVCRTPLAFIVKSLEFLKKDGTLLAILPLSCIKSEADLKIFDQLSVLWDIEKGAKHGPKTFKGCSPSSIILSFKKKSEQVRHTKLVSLPQFNSIKIEIMRGTISMPSTNSIGKYPVLHTVHLKNNLTTQVQAFTDKKIKYVEGYCVCIPRVCKPLKDKIVFIKKGDFVLSDCLFAIRAKTIGDTKKLQQVILSYWTTFAEMYESTCAPYITTKQLQLFFKSYGIDSVVVGQFSNKNTMIDLKPTFLDVSIGQTGMALAINKLSII